MYASRGSELVAFPYVEAGDRTAPSRFSFRKKKGKAWVCRRVAFWLFGVAAVAPLTFVAFLLRFISRRGRQLVFVNDDFLTISGASTRVKRKLKNVYRSLLMNIFTMF